MGRRKLQIEVSSYGCKQTIAAWSPFQEQKVHSRDALRGAEGGRFRLVENNVLSFYGVELPGNENPRFCEIFERHALTKLICLVKNATIQSHDALCGRLQKSVRRDVGKEEKQFWI